MPTRWVFDTNVFVRAFLPDREDAEKARDILALLVAGDIVAVAPKNMLYEFCGGISGACRRREKGAEEALGMIRDFRCLPITYVESDEITDRAVRLSFDRMKRFYDTCFLAVAEREGVRLCTADARLIAGLAPGDPCEFVLLRDFAPCQ